MRFLQLIAHAFLATAAAGFSADVLGAQTQLLECAQASNMPNEGVSLPAAGNPPASSTFEPSALEAACRSALKSDPANPTLMFRLARALSLGNKRLEAIRYYLDSADRGSADAMNDLGGVFEFGVGVPANMATALVWYERAAEFGHAGAMTLLGQRSELGLGVAQDFANARHWYGKAAALGNPHAMGQLGALIESGRGGPQSLEAARELYVKGAARNGRVAMHHLGAMLENGRGTAKDIAQAISWYERAAALEYPPALNDLGRLHLAGAGVAKNHGRAKALFEQAASLGDAEAMNNLGMLYVDGTGVQKDLDLARIWFEKAISLDSAEARENLKRLEQAALGQGAQIAARRASCVQTCTALQRSYVSSVCEHYWALADSDDPERTKCVLTGLTAAKQCRESCREWAATLRPDNECITCFQSMIACSVGQDPSDGQGNAKPPYAAPKVCLASLADCTASCSGQAAPRAGAPDASSGKLD
jgi:TPR repeat protein